MANDAAKITRLIECFGRMMSDVTYYPEPDTGREILRLAADELAALQEQLAAYKKTNVEYDGQWSMMAERYEKAEMESVRKDAEIAKMQGDIDIQLSTIAEQRKEIERLRAIEKAARKWDKEWVFLYGKATLRLQEHNNKPTPSLCQCPLCARWRSVREKTMELHAALSANEKEDVTVVQFKGNTQVVTHRPEAKWKEEVCVWTADRTGKYTVWHASCGHRQESEAPGGPDCPNCNKPVVVKEAKDGQKRPETGQLPGAGTASA